MRTTFSSVAILASSLLAREIFAAPHLHKHKRDVVEDVVMVTDEITVTDEGDGNYQTGAAVAIGTTTIDGTRIVISSTPAPTPSTEAPATVAPATEAPATEAPSTTALPSSSSPPAAVFIQKPSSSSTPTTSAEPTTTAPVIIIPTVSASKSPTTLATSASTSAPAPVSTVTSDSSKKRGLAYNDAGLLSGFLSGNSLVSWAYNWASSTASIPSGLEFVPILWSTEDSFTSVWNANAAGASHLMSFNEPDFSGQANMNVSAAVDGYMEYLQPYVEKGVSVGTPAVTNGGAPMGLTYLGNFISGLSDAGGSYDFCSIHWYDSATNIDYFKSYMQQASTTCGAGKKLWITEFGVTGSDDEQNTFLQTVLPWLDEQDYVERYAFFMVAPGNLISSGTSLSTLGSTYATFT
ncbi:hypothetical protein D0Z07_6002 [Hyphodiscus hymeniophilus]|uniref:Asl1-like glycosyl hydrolase catalytic domain-containing protein n=1 Tax=Hyphodiscus hymeniophilus TaxID=353542 RepID=A0A9P6VI52_9HELO|nr:hypothetical protein D0Z07_6002 [Hyphodiscus hymeniophilus]